jgi:hypothetical protein
MLGSQRERIVRILILTELKLALTWSSSSSSLRVVALASCTVGKPVTAVDASETRDSEPASARKPTLTHKLHETKETWKTQAGIACSCSAAPTLWGEKNVMLMAFIGNRITGSNSRWCLTKVEEQLWIPSKEAASAPGVQTACHGVQRPPGLQLSFLCHLQWKVHHWSGLVGTSDLRESGTLEAKSSRVRVSIMVKSSGPHSIPCLDEFLDLG